MLLPLQKAVSHCPNFAEPPLGRLPNADPLSSAASSCCKSCIRDWSSATRLDPFDFFETSLQKPPISWLLGGLVSSSVLFTARPQIDVSPATDATPGNVCP